MSRQLICPAGGRRTTFLHSRARLTPICRTDTTKLMSAAGEPKTDAALDPLRAQIDKIDEQLIALLNERAKVVVEIGKVKQQSKAPIYAPDREKAVLEKVRRLNKGPLPNRCI